MQAGRSVYAQLTEGVALPLAALPQVLMKTIADGIVAAWRSVPPQQAKTADEPALNAMMETQLNQLADRDDRFGALVAAVVRGKETINCNGDSLEKRPDLSMILTNGIRARDFPLTIECKLIDRSTNKRVDQYCKDGLRRFVDGDYGWARPEAIMLAYVRDGSTVNKQLTPHLARYRDSSNDPYCTEILPESIRSQVDQAQSQHGRHFRYIDRPPPNDDPGPIKLRHIWLNAAKFQ